MTLKQAISHHHKQLLSGWFTATINTYPQQSAKILSKDVNRFDNPVGAVSRESLDAVLTLVSGAFTMEELEKTLDPIIRIRAVQAFSASEAVSFVFALKKIGEDLLPREMQQPFDRLVDDIALAAFNRLMKCKEEIFLLKAVESKRRIHRAFERAGLVAELTEAELLGSDKS
jgi:hypothetical protein